MGRQGTQTSQNNIEKEQSYSNQDSWVQKE